MTITRAKKTPHTTAAAVPRTPDEFIAAAATEPPRPTPAANASAASDPQATERQQRARLIVDRHVPWAAAAGLLPLPGVDLAAILGVQLRMLASVAQEYGEPFKEQAAKSAVATLMAAVLQNTVAGGLASGLKFVPVVGTLTGIAALPALAAAGTYAVGKVFITHFEAGGTFLDLDPDKVREHFRKEFDNARRTR